MRWKCWLRVRVRLGWRKNWNRPRSTVPKEESSLEAEQVEHPIGPNPRRKRARNKEHELLASVLTQQKIRLLTLVRMNINAWFRRRRKDKSNRWWYWSGWSSWLGNSIGLDIDLKAYWSGLNKVSCLRRGCRCRRRSSSEQQIILLAKKKDRYLLTLSPLITSQLLLT